MRISLFLLSLLCHHVTAFAPFLNKKLPASSLVKLNAIGVLARKAKEADVRKYCEDGVEDTVMEQYHKLKQALSSEEAYVPSSEPGPLQQVLTRRRGTITVIAEYKRKMENAGFIADEIFDPEILSPTFREFGASGIAVLADERMGGCTYKDLKSFVIEQRRARNEVPGSVTVINNDLIVDEVQIARSAAVGAQAIVFNLGILGEDKLTSFLKAAQALEMESIVSVSSSEEAQTAVDLGARLIKVDGVKETDAMGEIIASLDIPEGVDVCTIANILANSDKGLQEVEDVWICRDRGFNCAWVSDVLYKSGHDSTEHPGAIIKSMTAKSSVKWASPKARGGKGEGAREYLGDIMM